MSIRDWYDVADRAALEAVSDFTPSRMSVREALDEFPNAFDAARSVVDDYVHSDLRRIDMHELRDRAYAAARSAR